MMSLNAELIQQRRKLEEGKAVEGAAFWEAEKLESMEHVWLSPAEQGNLIPSKALTVKSQHKRNER